MCLHFLFSSVRFETWHAVWHTLDCVLCGKWARWQAQRTSCTSIPAPCDRGDRRSKCIAVPLPSIFCTHPGTSKTHLGWNYGSQRKRAAFATCPKPVRPLRCPGAFSTGRRHSPTLQTFPKVARWVPVRGWLGEVPTKSRLFRGTTDTTPVYEASAVPLVLHATPACGRRLHPVADTA